MDKTQEPDMETGFMLGLRRTINNLVSPRDPCIVPFPVGYTLVVNANNTTPRGTTYELF